MRLKAQHHRSKGILIGDRLKLYICKNSVRIQPWTIYIHILSPPKGTFKTRLRCLNNGDLNRQVYLRIVLLIVLISLSNERLGVNTILSTILLDMYCYILNPCKPSTDGASSLKLPNNPPLITTWSRHPQLAATKPR